VIDGKEELAQEVARSIQESVRKNTRTRETRYLVTSGASSEVKINLLATLTSRFPANPNHSHPDWRPKRDEVISPSTMRSLQFAATRYKASLSPSHETNSPNERTTDRYDSNGSGLAQRTMSLSVRSSQRGMERHVAIVYLRPAIFANVRYSNASQRKKTGL
jgi:hypothetical protein